MFEFVVSDECEEFDRKPQSNRKKPLYTEYSPRVLHAKTCASIMKSGSRTNNYEHEHLLMQSVS